MPRQTELSEAEVFRAIEVLLANGDYPTSARLREALDHRGSPVVLQRFLGAWYAQHGPELAKRAAAAPAKTLAGGLQAELKRLTATAVQEVETAQAERIAALDARAAALDARDADLLAREQRLDARESAHAEHLVDLRAQLEAAAATQFRLEEARDRALEEDGVYRGQVEALKAASEIRETELDRLRAAAEQIPALQAALERVQADVTREQARVVELVGERDRLQRLASERAAELAKVKGQLDRADEAATAQTAILAETRQQLQDATIELAAQRVRGEALARELEQAVAGRRGDAERLEALRQAVADAEQRQAVLTAQLIAAQAERARLEGLATDIAGLKDAVQGLGGQLRPPPGRRGSPGSED